jgi:hypothetical protein
LSLLPYPKKRRKCESRLRKVGEEAITARRTQHARWTYRRVPLVSFPISPNLGARFFLRGVDL